MGSLDAAQRNQGFFPTAAILDYAALHQGYLIGLKMCLLVQVEEGVAGPDEPASIIYKELMNFKSADLASGDN